MLTPHHTRLAGVIPTVLMTILLARPTSSSTPIGEWVQGTASFFGGPQGTESNAYKLSLDSGSCGYGDFDPRLYPNYNVVGIHPTNALAQERPQAACGSCLEIECTAGANICYPGRKALQVVVTDQCDQDCNATNINMHVLSFEELAPLKFGRIGIRYRLINCEPTDPIAIHVANYRAALGGWIRLSLKNVGGDAGVTSVEVAPAGSNVNAAPGEGGWQLMDNTFGAVWEASKLPDPPMDIRFDNSIMQTVVVKNAIAEAGKTGDVETTAQFPVPNAQISVTAAAAPTVIVGQAINTTAEADAAVAGVVDPAVDPTRTVVANTPSQPSSGAAVVPPEAAGASQGGAHPLTNALDHAANDLVMIDAHPAEKAVLHQQSSTAGGRRMLAHRSRTE